MANYFLSDGTQAIGPYSAEQLATMQISGDTGVRAEDAVEWKRADHVEELQPELAARAQAAADSRAPSGMAWGPLQDKGYTKPGHRMYSAHLQNIPHGQDWQHACLNMPHTINNHWFPRPTRCINNWGMYGEWDVPDPAFADTFNAIVFLYPDIPAVPLLVTELQLGHVGWGFRLDDGRWCWGATELSLPHVDSPKPNGVFIERGTREQMMACFRDGVRKDGKGLPWRYYSYKAVRANNPRAAHAEKIAEATKHMGYTVIGNNCMTHTMMIINEYAGYPIVPLPVIQPWQQIPRVWFTFINATEYHVNQNFWDVKGAAA